MKNTLIRASLAATLCIAAVSQAEDRWTSNLYFENDLFTGTDLNYTNGVRLSFISPDIDSFLTNREEAYPWVNKINHWLRALHPSPPKRGDVNVQRNMVLSTGQLMFTPTDRLRRDVDPNDRPYAGWLYGGVGYQARVGDRLHTAELHLGVVGPWAKAHETQDFVHEARNIGVFHGWHNQLENELGVQVVFERKRRYSLTQEPIMGFLDMDFINHYGASIGNVASYVNAGGEVRIGYRLPNDFGVSMLRPGGDNSAPGLGKLTARDWHVYGFVATDVRLVANNIFLDGNTFRDSHSVDKEYLVGDVALGAAAIYERWKLSYSHVFRSKEFRQQQEGQAYGSVSISYSF
ncbi:MAG: lipid A deacylase LpxR family protein [Cellvibrionaceae bacterium]|nr:lipid A deacylase LpxR family protein [Cellvibrionaceae bacterium]MCV6627207.1 lipid A deacylase LpxR family protein [Cellvibrionaceae bacterium]